MLPCCAETRANELEAAVAQLQAELASKEAKIDELGAEVLHYRGLWMNEARAVELLS